MNTRLNQVQDGLKKRVGIGGRDRKAIGRSVKSCEMVKPCIGVWTPHWGVGPASGVGEKEKRQGEGERSFLLNICLEIEKSDCLIDRMLTYQRKMVSYF